MKIPALLLLFLLPAPVFAQADSLAAPLRKFDTNHDGLLTGEELRLARQAHNRGGRDIEPNENRWRDILGRMENDFSRRRRGEFDLNGDGKTEGPEQEEMRKVWRQIAGRYTDLRKEITAKYDRDDDGELNERERDESRPESERRRREVEDKLLAEWRAALPPKPEAAKSAAAAAKN